MFPLQKDEKVLMYIRRHWIWLFIESKIAFLVFLLPSVFLFYIANNTSFGSEIVFGVSGFDLSNVLISMWAIFCWIYMAERFTDYALNFWIITNQRIMECELNGLFNTKTNTMEIEDVEDASIATPGFWAQFFGFGTLQIQSAGATREFIAEHVKDADVAKQMVFALKSRIKDEDNVSEQEMENLFKRSLNSQNGFKKDEEKTEEKTVLENNKGDEHMIEYKATENIDYDWAKISEKQGEDIRNKIEEIEKVSDDFKKDAGDALKF